MLGRFPETGEVDSVQGHGTLPKFMKSFDDTTADWKYTGYTSGGILAIHRMHRPALLREGEYI